MRLNDRAVVRERRRLAIEVELDVAQVLVARIRERHTGADHPRQRPGVCLGEDVSQPRLRGALREAAGRRAAALGPGWADGAIDLAPVRQAVLRAPDRATRAVEAIDVAGDRRHQHYVGASLPNSPPS